MSFPERPLSEIFGHAKEIAALRTIVGQGLNSASFLLWGPEGVGKKTVATALSRDFLCVSAGLEGACGGCESCRTSLWGHPDFRFLDSGEELSIGIDRVREFLEETREMPLLSPLRVGIVDQAHRLTPEAANSLLKSVEEPPGTMLFFFITSLPDRLLPTLRSRLLEVRFKPLPEEILAQMALRDFNGRPEEEIRDAVILAGGSVTRLYELMNSTFREGQEKIRKFLESVRPDRNYDQTTIADSWPFLSEKEGFDQFLDSIERLLLSCERSLAGGDADHSWSGSSLPGEYAHGMADFRRAQLHDRIGEMRRLMVHNINRGLALEQFLWHLDSSFHSGPAEKQ